MNWDRSSDNLPSCETSSAILRPDSSPSGHMQKSGCSQVPEGSPPNLASSSIMLFATLTSPTGVLTTFPPTSAIASSMQIPASTVVTTVPPKPLEISAKSLSKSDTFPVSSTVIILSASPSCAIPKSDPVATTAFLRLPRLASLGSGFLPGKNPSTCEFKVITLHPAFLKAIGEISEPAPHAQSITTLNPGFMSTALTRSLTYWFLISSL